MRLLPELHWCMNQRALYTNKKRYKEAENPIVSYVTSLNTNLYLLLENLLFFAIATSFFGVVGWAWRD